MAKKAKKISGVLIAVLIIVGIIILLSSLIITREDKYTLVKRFGKIERIIDTAGLSIKTPFVETVDTMPKNIQFYDMPESDVITMDKKTMVTDSYVLWKVTDPLKFAQSLNANVSLAKNRIDTTVYNSMKNVISSLSQADVISGRDGELDNAFMLSIGDNMSQYGIDLISVETKHLDLPGGNKTAVFERMISERAQMAATYTAEGASEAQKIHNTTDREVAINISNAETKASKIIAEGEAIYMKTLADAYSSKKRSDFYSFIRSLQAVKASLSGEDKTLILSKDSPIAEIFNHID
jgi:membrane protease subunit HflC